MKFTKTRKSDWFTKPGMVGHYVAQETVALAEEVITKYAKTKGTRLIANYVIKDIPEWNYWINVTKKEINLLRWVLRRFDKALTEKGGLTKLLAGYQNRTGCLKGHIDWVLEHLAFVHDKESRVADYTRNMGFWGLSKKEATERLTKYHKNLIEKHEVLDAA